MERKFVKKELIEKGWSKDKKYCVTDDNGQKFLLRISSLEQLEYKKAEFENMKEIYALGIPMCEPIEFGTCEEGVYSLQSWIDGEDAEEMIPTLPDEQAYVYGCEAGKILRKLHEIPAPEEIEDWELFFNRKMNRKIELYRACDLKYENGEVFIEYIEENRHLLKNRPQTYQHGDYHLGNFMIDRKGQLVVIDFNRNDFGDPWEEFNRIVWCAQVSSHFATGMVDGYFSGNVPMDFWKLLAMYISSNTLSSLPWAIPFGQAEVEVMRNQARDILEWYDNMKNPVPKWYRNDTIHIKQIKLDKSKENIAKTILESLPDWFGIPESIEEYVADTKGKPFFCAYDEDIPIGFLYLKETGQHTVELAVMGVLKEYHRQGIGRTLFEHAKNEAKRLGYSFIQVKTVQMGRYGIYDDTNHFYRSLGFKELEVFPMLWDEWNPCQIYIMAI